MVVKSIHSLHSSLRKHLWTQESCHQSVQHSLLQLATHLYWDQNIHNFQLPSRHLERSLEKANVDSSKLGRKKEFSIFSHSNHFVREDFNHFWMEIFTSLVITSYSLTGLDTNYTAMEKKERDTIHQFPLKSDYSLSSHSNRYKWDCMRRMSDERKPAKCLFLPAETNWVLHLRSMFLWFFVIPILLLYYKPIQ